MITFVDTLVRILNDDDFIKDVDCSHMWLTDTAMTVLPYHLSPHLYLKLMRLQTIKIHQYDLMDSLVPSHVRRIAAEIHTDQVTVTIQSTEINSDCARRINMLDWLIVEEVRRAIPSECERLNVKYAIDAKRDLRYKSLQI